MQTKKSMTRDGLLFRISMGDDIEFECRGKFYTILAWCDEGINIAEQCHEETEQIFKDGEDLLAHFMIDGEPLGEILSEVKAK